VISALIANIVKPNLYQDSVALMQIAAKLKAIEGIEEASLMMGTGPNREILQEAGLLSSEGDGAGPNDLLIALRGSDEALTTAAREVEALIQGQGRGGGRGGSGGREAEERLPRTVAEGAAWLPGASLALISTPGLYAAAEARKALHLGLHTMIFSDNVSIEDERDLKQMALERGLLVMGPDCGTAIISGVPLGFANVVRRGPVGVVGASGTGMQEITTLVDRYGSGISQAIGTGSHDLSQQIGGAMTIQGLYALMADPQTAVVVLVSKPPHPEVAARVLDAAASGKKPVVVIFLGAQGGSGGGGGGGGQDGKPANLTFAGTLTEAAQLAVALAGGEASSRQGTPLEVPRVALAAGQRYVRGLFSGGTFCSEATIILSRALGEVYSNTPVSPELALADLQRSVGHTCLDMGADEFTVGRPHPMIDMSARSERIVAESQDPEVAVLLLDVVLGYGSSPDPAGALAGAIREARRTASEGGRELAVVAHVCGTQADPQGLEAQRATLAGAGAILATSNAAAAELAARIASKGTRAGAVAASEIGGES
jgi:succinyl-CoA synthetase alpha subunit